MKGPAAYAHVDILLIEDDPSIGVMYKLQLEHDGHRVRLVADAQSGIAQALLALQDLILLDFRLPEEDGLSLLARLREQLSLRHCPGGDVEQLRRHRSARTRRRAGRT